MLFDIDETEGFQIADEAGIPDMFEDPDPQVPEPDNPGFFQRIKGWVVGKAKGLKNLIRDIFNGDFGIGNLIRRAAGWLVQTSSFIWNFNWNISPEQIEDRVKTSLLNLSGLLGELTGGALGWTFCGLGGASLVGAFNPVVGAKVAMEVGGEMREEMFSYLGTFANGLVQAGSSAAFLYGYSSVRRLVLKFLGRDEQLEQIESGRAKPWSFALKWDNFIERLEDMGLPVQMVANWLESLREEFADSCSEAFMVIADSIADMIEIDGIIERKVNPNRLVEVTVPRE